MVHPQANGFAPGGNNPDGRGPRPNIAPDGALKCLTLAFWPACEEAWEGARDGTGAGALSNVMPPHVAA